MTNTLAIGDEAPPPTPHCYLESDAETGCAHPTITGVVSLATSPHPEVSTEGSLRGSSLA